MNLSRRGKIARLPKAVRDLLNRRLQDGESAGPILHWLNALPEVKTVLAAEFNGQPIRPQNLSEWRQGGYRDWEAQQEALELAERLTEDSAELQTEGRPPLTDTLALWLAARYAVVTRHVSQAEGPAGWRALRELCADIVELRRGDHSAERLRLEREQLEWERQRQRQQTEAELWEWAMQPDNRARICQGFRTRAEKIALLRKVMFADVDALEETGEVDAALSNVLAADAHPCECREAPASLASIQSNQGESSPIKPDQAPPSGLEASPQAQSNAGERTQSQCD
jgi:hypothetical protein